MNTQSVTLQVPERKLLPAHFTLTTWAALEPYFQELKDREINSPEDLKSWLAGLSELEAVISEDASWRQIAMTRNTTDKAIEEAFTYFVTEIEPKMKPWLFALNQKLANNPFTKDLDPDTYYTYLRNVRNSLDLYREENIAIQSELSLLAQQYGVLSSKMSIDYAGKEYTLQQAAKFLQSEDRQVRETVFRKVAERRLQDKDELNNLFDQLLQRRHQVAINAGFDNYRDYKFRELGRFDYTIEDCFAFHTAVRTHIVPLHRRLQQDRKARLQVDTLRPWDLDAEPAGTQPLQPFTNGEDLTQKSIDVFNRLDPYFGGCIATMKNMERLDLDSRKGKAPGGYNCPLSETGVPFIFMNAAGTMSDVTTMMHEGGHAFHSFLSHPLELSAFKEYPHGNGRAGQHEHGAVYYGTLGRILPRCRPAAPRQAGRAGTRHLRTALDSHYR